MTAETELQERLTRLAERTAPPPRETLAQVVAAQHRSQRRQTAGIGALVAVVAAVVIAVPAVTGGSADRPVTASGTAVDAGATVDVLAGPPRGSLAGDTAFVEGVRRLDWSPEGSSWGAEPDAPLGTRRVVFAGEVAGVRVALVAGENTVRPTGAAADPDRQTDLGALGDTAVAWFLGPAGATPEQMVLQSVPYGVQPDGGPVALFDRPSGALVVVGAPGDSLSLSLRPDVRADGSAAREYLPLDAPDGTATVDLSASATSASALRYVVSRGGETWTRTPDGSSAGDARPDPPVTWLHPAPPASPADVMAASGPALVLSQLGLPESDVAFTVVWAGDVPAPAAEPTARVSLLAATLPSGAVYLDSSLAVVTGDGVGGTSCGSGVRGAGPPLAEQTFALRCDATDMSEHSEVLSSLVVVAPPAAVQVRALDLDGEVLADFALTDGVGVVPFPERAADVQTLSADGTVLQTTRPLTSADLGD